MNPQSLESSWMVISSELTEPQQQIVAHSNDNGGVTAFLERVDRIFMAIALHDNHGMSTQKTSMLFASPLLISKLCSYPQITIVDMTTKQLYTSNKEIHSLALELYGDSFNVETISPPWKAVIGKIIDAYDAAIDAEDLEPQSNSFCAIS
jgi:hypothetical protein